MTSIDILITHFTNYIPLNNVEKTELNNRVTERRIKRRQFILQENDVCKHYTFVVSGCLKMYAVDKNGGEHNIQFASEMTTRRTGGLLISEVFIQQKEAYFILRRLNLLLYYN